MKSQGGTSCQVRLEEAAPLWREDAAAGATLRPPLPAGTHACPGQGPSILLPFWPPLSGPGSPALPATVLGLWAYVFDAVSSLPEPP